MEEITTSRWKTLCYFREKSKERERAREKEREKERKKNGKNVRIRLLTERKLDKEEKAITEIEMLEKAREMMA